MTDIEFHGHLDQWDEYFGMVEHGHVGGDKSHSHNESMVGGIKSHFRYVPESLINNPYMVADWSDDSAL